MPSCERSREEEEEKGEGGFAVLGTGSVLEMKTFRRTSAGVSTRTLRRCGKGGSGQVKGGGVGSAKGQAQVTVKTGRWRARDGWSGDDTWEQTWYLGVRWVGSGRGRRTRTPPRYRARERRLPRTRRFG